jgi:hypothetical protein
MRQEPAGLRPALRLDTSQLDFPNLQRGTKSAKYILFENNGTTTLKVNFTKGCFSINGDSANLGYWDVFYYKHPETGSSFRDFSVPAGQAKSVAFVFYPRADGPIGKYSMIILFQTNDPKNPYVEISLTGNAI